MKTVNAAPGGVIQFSSATYNTTESSRLATITVQRIGDLSQAVTVDYATPDDSAATPTILPCSTAGFVSARCDFTTSVGTMKFAANESSKTFDVLISQDNYVEGPESLTLTLSNPTNGAVLSAPFSATLTIADDASEPATNPIDDSQNFVRQHYHDFLNREPVPVDQAGLDFWTNQIESCGADQACRDIKRQNVSASSCQSSSSRRVITSIALTRPPLEISVRRRCRCRSDTWSLCGIHRKCREA